MNIGGSLVLLGFFVLFYSITVEVFTVLFRLTGVTQDKARTQVISLLTNSGFTTSDSEIIMSSKRRRRLARIAMLSGYFFAVIIVSVLLNIFLSMNYSDVQHWADIVTTVGILACIYILAKRSKKLGQSFDLFIEKLGNRLMFGKHSNPLILIDVVRTKALVEVSLTNIPAFMENKTLIECDLKRDYDIQVLYIRRGGKSLPLIDGNTTIQKEDCLLVFGEYKTIRAVFERVED
ncbi:MAG: TrkA C-terminal domain-containing protein [Enterococcus sp.]